MKIFNFNKISLVEENRKTSYKDLINYINNYENYLKNVEGNRIAILFENRVEWIAMFLAIWKSKKIAIPIDSDIDEKDFDYIIKNAEADFTIYSPKTSSKIKENKGIDIEKIEIKDTKIEDIDFNFNINEVATIIYTSGTSSNPVGVKLSKENMFQNMQVLTESTVHRKSDIIVLPLPLHHSYPLIGILQALSVGATIIILREINSEKLRVAIQENRPTSIIMVPLLVERIHRELMKRINSSSINKIFFNLAKILKIETFKRLIFKKVHQFFGGNLRVMPCGGAHLDINIQKDFYTLGIKISPGYGLTETAPLISAAPLDPKIGAAGKIVKGIEFKIVDGEIVVKGKQLMLGYQNREDLMKDRIKDGWFYTGDLGYLDNEGYLFITGRKKELIILANGKNIWPTEIENTINELDPIIKECALIENEGKLKLLVLPSTFSPDIENKIKQIINDKYNSKAQSYKIINEIKIINKTIPRTRLGKIQRYKLNEL